LYWIKDQLRRKDSPNTLQGRRVSRRSVNSMRIAHAFWLQPLLSKQYDELLEKAITIARAKLPSHGVLFSWVLLHPTSPGYFISSQFFRFKLTIALFSFCDYSLAFRQGIRMYMTDEIAQSGTVVTSVGSGHEIKR
jgi:ATP-binding cassette subfamily B (MDR/TAP) protein 1